MPTHTIEIDEQILALLHQEAKPFVDSPNDVLRRLLLASAERSPQGNHANRQVHPLMSGRDEVAADPEPFVKTILAQEFGDGFRKVPPYRLMFSSQNRLVYFQNFSKEASHLWYRVTTNPWKHLRSSQRSSSICFTNPVERYAYVIPVADIQERVRRASWVRDYLEVNIDTTTSRWSELEWDLTPYRKAFSAV